MNVPLHPGSDGYLTAGRSGPFPVGWARQATAGRWAALLLLATAAVARAQDLQYTASNSTVTITGYAGTGGVVRIPGVIEGLPVTRIGAEAFYGCTNVTRVVVPGSVTSIGDWAFYDCVSLTNLAIGNDVAQIGNWAFHHCSSLGSVTLGTNVTSLGDWVRARTAADTRGLRAAHPHHP